MATFADDEAFVEEEDLPGKEVDISEPPKVLVGRAGVQCCGIIERPARFKGICYKPGERCGCTGLGMLCKQHQLQWAKFLTESQQQYSHLAFGSGLPPDDEVLQSLHDGIKRGCVSASCDHALVWQLLYFY